jgi:hypothetical protein
MDQGAPRVWQSIIKELSRFDQGASRIGSESGVVFHVAAASQPQSPDTSPAAGDVESSDQKTKGQAHALVSFGTAQRVIMLTFAACVLTWPCCYDAGNAWQLQALSCALSNVILTEYVVQYWLLSAADMLSDRCR